MGMALCVLPENNVVTHRLHIHHPPGEREVVPLTGVLHSSSFPSEESRGQVAGPVRWAWLCAPSAAESLWGQDSCSPGGCLLAAEFVLGRCFVLVATFDSNHTA